MRPRDYKHWMEILTEHKMYTMYNGEPLKNDSPFKSCDNHLEILFTTASTVCKNDVPNILAHQFNFKLIFEFLNGTFNPDYLYVICNIISLHYFDFLLYYFPLLMLVPFVPTRCNWNPA